MPQGHHARQTCVAWIATALILASSPAPADTQGVRIVVHADGTTVVRQSSIASVEPRLARSILKESACRAPVQGAPAHIAAAPDTSYENVMAMIDWLQDCGHRVVFLTTLGSPEPEEILVRIPGIGTPPALPLLIAPARTPSAPMVPLNVPHPPPLPLSAIPSGRVAATPPADTPALRPVAPRGPVVVSLSKDRSLHVEDSSGTWTTFPLEQASAAAAAGLKTAEPTGAIHIRADPETPFGQFMDLLRRLHESGHPELRVIGEAVRPPA